MAIKTDKTNGAYCDAFYKSSGTYMGVVIRAIASGGRATSGRTWTLVDSNEVGGTTATDKKTSSECWKTIADAGTALHKQAYSASAPAKDEGYVASAGSANTSSSCAGNSASATKLTSSAGSATQPVYFKDGKPVAGTYTLGDASSKTVRTLGAVGNTGWTNKTTDDKYVPTMSFMAYWNGAYYGTSSNLQYCDRGRFGTIVTKGSGDYAAAGHTHNYAGSGSAGGSANSAVKLDSNAGSSVQPVYFSGGKPVAIGYTISSSVPANAKFTDTTYGVASSSSNGLMSSTDKTKLDDFSRVISINKNQFATAGHNHDSRYYTESEIDSKLDDKSNVGHTHDYLPTAGGTMNGTIAFSDYAHGKIYAGPTDNVNGPGGDLNNIVLESWWGLSFTTGCPNQTYTGKTAVGIDCREGIVKAVQFDGKLNGTAARLGRGGDPNAPMTFNWSGKDGQPTWLWGGEDGANMYVYNPANFVVHYADWANGANNGVVSYGFGSNSDGYIRFINGVQICWGRTNCSGKDTTINFSAAFSNSSYSVSTMPFYSNLAGTYWNVQEGSMGTTGFVLHGSKSSIDLRTMLWIAIGKWN